MKKTMLTLIAVMVLAGCGTDTTTVQIEPAPAVNQDLTQTTTLTSMNQAESLDSVVNIEASYIDWKGGKAVGGDHYGQVRLKSAALDMAEDKIQAGKVVVDMTTISVTDLEGDMAQLLIDKFMGDDFFMVDQYPVATMEFDTVEYTDETTANVTGNLTIKNITKPVNFTVTQTNDRLTTQFVIDRTEWSIRVASGKFFDDLGDNVINDEIEFKVTLMLNERESEETTDIMPVETEEITAEMPLESRIEE